MGLKWGRGGVMVGRGGVSWCGDKSGGRLGLVEGVGLIIEEVR